MVIICGPPPLAFSPWEMRIASWVQHLGQQRAMCWRRGSGELLAAHTASMMVVAYRPGKDPSRH